MHIMETLILLSYLIILMSAVTSIGGTTEEDNFNSVRPAKMPADQCDSADQLVCSNCHSVGRCLEVVEGSFLVQTVAECGYQEICTNDFGNATCSSIDLSPPQVCSCNSGHACELDPYDPSGYIVCTGEIPAYAQCLDTEEYNLDLCECEPVCFSCGYYSPGPQAEECGSYYSCATGNWVEETCPEGECFSGELCSCLEACRPCGYIADQNNTSGFYYCENGPYVPGTCHGVEFNGTTCECEFGDSTTASSSVTETTSDPSDPCNHCGYYEYPNSCNRYYKCLEDGTVEIEECPQDLCFDPESCICDIPGLY